MSSLSSRLIDSYSSVRTNVEPIRVLTLSSRLIVSITFSSSILAVIIAAVFAVTVDRYRLFDYYWMCEKVLLPSFSRVVNLPYERTFWNLLILSQAPLRVATLFHYYCHFAYFCERNDSRITSIALVLFVIAGALDIGFLTALTVVGEREDGNMHMVFFICFMLATIAFISAHLLLSIRCGLSGKREIFAFRLRLLLFFALMIIVPLLTSAFYAFQEHCVKHAYSTFALLEYATIAIVLIYHATPLIDIDYSLNLVYFDLP